MSFSTKHVRETHKYIYATDFIHLISFCTKPNIKIDRIAAYLIDKNFDQQVTSYFSHRGKSYVKDLHRESFGFDLNTREFLAKCDSVKNATSKYFLPCDMDELETDFLYLIEELNTIECIKNLNIDFSLTLQADDAARKWYEEIEKPIFRLLDTFQGSALGCDVFRENLVKFDSYSVLYASCLLSGDSVPEIKKFQDHMEFTRVFSKYISYKLMIELAIRNDELQINDGYISAANLKEYLAKNGYFFKGFNDWMAIEPAKPLIITKPNGQLEADNDLLEEARAKIAELENELLQVQEAKPKAAVIPFGRRLDFISKDLPQSERIKKSYELWSDNISFYEDTHPVNKPDEMIKRIQGLINVIDRKNTEIFELEKQIENLRRSPEKQNQLNERTEKSYQTTIALLLELMISPKGIDSKKPFPSQAVIISEIVEQSIYGQSKSTLEARFSNANNILLDVKKK
ncbi:hypothetical protein ACTXJF_02215 [Psychrobacter alimentarius]|uniref:hypothetical protein n=1 Tax=Psychrobacter alimentarius TaxID=261164 RepID=UPI003FD2AC55